MSADVPTSVSLAPFAFRLAAAAGQLYLDHALGHNVVDLELGMDRVAVQDLRHCQAQQRSCRVHKPAVTEAPGEEEVLYVPAAGCELLPHLGVEVVVASVDGMGTVSTAASRDESGGFWPLARPQPYSSLLQPPRGVRTD